MTTDSARRRVQVENESSEGGTLTRLMPRAFNGRVHLIKFLPGIFLRYINWRHVESF